MRLMFVPFAALLLLASGCFTSKAVQSDIQKLQTRLSVVESDLRQNQETVVEIKQEHMQVGEAIKKSQDADQILKGRIDGVEAKVDALAKAKEEKEVAAKSKTLTEKEVQAALKKAGFYKGEIDGVMGKQTKEAIIKFQEANDLEADGVVGSRTRALLLKHLKD